MSVVSTFEKCPCAAKGRRGRKACARPTEVLHGDGARWHRRSAEAGEPPYGSESDQ